MINTRELSGRIAPAAADTESSRYCPECDGFLPFSEFYKDKRVKSGYTRRCRRHHSRKSYYSRSKLPNKGRRYEDERRRLLRDYGLTEEDYDRLLAEQDGVCAICGLPGSSKFGLLCVDHDHVTHSVRGLLCCGCNTGLGKFKDDEERLLAAVRYLGRARAV